MIAIPKPNGEPSRCVVCATPNEMLCSKDSDINCIVCGNPLWKTNYWFLVVRDRLAESAGMPKEAVSMETRLDEMAEDSLSLVEAFMILEEEMELDPSEDEADRIKTVGDIVLLLARRF